ncbi:uncharacterized protein [Branchiostoma lanceolatum]|uniref:uncharacterized protein n=1 Tax=Branchiostoma lanceolatum TaxID=7740 RepID=UPI003452C096
MAAAPLSLGAQIGEELSCSICLELFTRPKVLPCQHTFCQDCLQDHASRRVPLQCPNCRQQVRLPPQGVAGLPDNLMAANMCERLQNQATLSGETREQPQSGNRCSFHPSEEVKLYCKQCNVPVCTECCEEGHDGHTTTGIKKAAQERSLTVQALINEGRNILESYLSFLRSLRGEEKTLNEQKHHRDNSIIQAYNQTVQKLTENKDLLLSESQQNHSKNLEKIQTERDRVLADLNELSAACDRAEQELQQGWVEFLSQQTALTEVVGKYRGKAAPTPVQTKPAVFQPTDTPVPVLGHMTVQSLPSAPIPAASAPIPAASAPIPAAPAPIPAAPAPIPAAPAPIPAAPAPIPAAPAASNDAARGRVHYHGNQRRGEHQPQNVTFGKEGSESGQFRDPNGVTVSDEGEIFVADKENQRIQVFTLQGIFVRQFPTVVSNLGLLTVLSGGQKMKPHDVAMDGKGNLWVVGKTDSAEFAVQYNKQGRVLRKFDLQKTGWIRGVAVDTRRNHILITKATGDWDTMGNLHGEVLVFRPDGTLVRTVGQQQGMKYPEYITVGREGRILVSDMWNRCVYVYNGDGQFLFQFGGYGSGEGQLKLPCGICTDRAGNIIVADSWNSHVEMFDKTGKFLKHIATDMENPCAVAMAPQRQLVVTDDENHTVSIIPTYWTRPSVPGPIPPFQDPSLRPRTRPSVPGPVPPSQDPSLRPRTRPSVPGPVPPFQDPSLGPRTHPSVPGPISPSQDPSLCPRTHSSVPGPIPPSQDPICLELFTRPKVLPCQHTFCQDCLQDHAGRGGTFQCPNCRQQVRLPRQGVAGLPDNHLVTSLCERLQNQATLSGETREQPQSGNRCSFHPSEEVKLYCKQCNVPVCTECCEEGHDGHPTKGLKKTAQERSLAVQALINEGRNILENYLSFLRSLREKEKTLNEQKQQRDNSIIQTYNQTVQTIMQKLTENKDLLLSESQQNHSENLDRIQTERDRVLADINELSAACDQAEQELQQGWAEILSQQTALTVVVGKYRGKAAPTPVQTQPAVFQPTDTPVQVLGHVTIQSLPSAPIQAAPAPIPAAPAPIPAAPAPIPAAPAPIPTAPAASFGAARGRGHHHGNQRQWEHQPQNVTFGEGGPGTGQFISPAGVTVSDEGEIFVADSGNQRIQVFTLQGTFVTQFPTVMPGGQKMGPEDVALDGEGNLWVVGRTESAGFAVQYNKQGRVLGKFDLQKTRWFRGVAVDTRRNHILITQTTGDLCNPTHGKVLVFRPDGTLVRTVGQQQGMKFSPYITVDGKGNIFVADNSNNCVYVYNSDGQFLFQFGGEGSGEGQLEYPCGICTDRAGNIIMADWGNSRVEMFDKTGKFLKHIATDMRAPLAVAMAPQGQLVVT